MTWTPSNGISAAILALLDTGEMSHPQIVLALPAYTSRQISQSLDHLIGARGGVRRLGKRGRYSYQRFVQEPIPRAVREFKPLVRDIFENWRLCDRDPLEVSRAAVHSFVR